MRELLVLFVFIFLTKECQLQEIEVEIEVEIGRESKQLWDASKWDEKTDISFDNCNDIQYPMGNGDTPRFCGNEGKQIKSEEWSRALIQAFTKLLNFYDPFCPPEGDAAETQLIKGFLNEFVTSEVGVLLYRLIYEKPNGGGRNECDSNRCERTTRNTRRTRRNRRTTTATRKPTRRTTRRTTTATRKPTRRTTRRTTTRKTIRRKTTKRATRKPTRRTTRRTTARKPIKRTTRRRTTRKKRTITRRVRGIRRRKGDDGFTKLMKYPMMNATNTKYTEEIDQGDFEDIDEPIEEIDQGDFEDIDEPIEEIDQGDFEDIGEPDKEVVSGDNGLTNDQQQLFDQLKDIWFGKEDGGLKRNIGFRHVFVGERKKEGRDTLAGFHSWYQFDRKLCVNTNRKQKDGFDFKYTYQQPKPRGQPTKVKYCTINLTWNGLKKMPSTILFGSRPEYDFAVFTLCYVKPPNDQTFGWKCRTDLEHGTVKPVAENNQDARGRNIQMSKLRNPGKDNSKLKSAYFK